MILLSIKYNCKKKIKKFAFEKIFFAFKGKLINTGINFVLIVLIFLFQYLKQSRQIYHTYISTI